MSFRRLRTSLLGVVVLGLFAIPGEALGGKPSWSFRLDRAVATAGENVSVAVSGTPGRRVRLYLVEAALAPRVRSQLDQRLQFLGALRVDPAGSASASFVLPSIKAGRYAVSAWCAACASKGRAGQFFPGAAPLLITAPARNCPVTSPSGGNPPGLQGSSWYGNAFLWTSVPDDGTLVAPAQLVSPDGSIAEKWFWYAANLRGDLIVRGARLDGVSPPLKFIESLHGTATGFTGSDTWASKITFPAFGCWRITGRVRDIALTFVVNVARPEGSPKQH
jgi:hypothetical protein